MDTQQFGRFIAEQRKAKGYTQKELAEKLAVTDKAISRWENGHGYPDIALLEPLAEELEITIAELMHSKRRDDADPAPEQADEAVANTIDLTVTNRRMERKTIILIYLVSVLLLAGLSFFSHIPVFGTIAIALMGIYAAAGLGLLIRTHAGGKKKAGADSKGFYAVLLLLVAAGILLVLLCSSVSIVH